MSASFRVIRVFRGPRFLPSRTSPLFCPLNTRRDAKFFRVEISEVTAPGQEALVFQSWVMAKVREQTQFASGRAQIIQDLRAVLITQDGDAFDFENDFVVANEIWVECLDQSAGAILQCLGSFRKERNSLEFELDLQALVVNRFVKAAAFIFVNLEACANNGVAFFLINQFCFFFFSCHFVCFVGQDFRLVDLHPIAILPPEAILSSISFFPLSTRKNAKFFREKIICKFMPLSFFRVIRVFRGPRFPLPAQHGSKVAQFVLDLAGLRHSKRDLLAQ
jgi:hypothetical protein